MYIPSYDFRIFDIPLFSALQADEYGASTQFNANTPVSHVDYSLNQLAGLLQPTTSFPYVQHQFPSLIDEMSFEGFFQGQTETVDSLRDRLTRIRDTAQQQLDKLGVPAVMRGKGGQTDQTQTQAKKCPEGYSEVHPFGIDWIPSYCGKQRVSDGQGTMGDKQAPAGLSQLETFMNALPQGSGVFLIAVIVIILLFLFVKR